MSEFRPAATAFAGAADRLAAALDSNPADARVNHEVTLEQLRGAAEELLAALHAVRVQAAGRLVAAQERREFVSGLYGHVWIGSDWENVGRIEAWRDAYTLLTGLVAGPRVDVVEHARLRLDQARVQARLADRPLSPSEQMGSDRLGKARTVDREAAVTSTSAPEGGAW